MQRPLGQSQLLLKVLGGKEQRGEGLESDHELIELVGLEAPVGLRRTAVGQRLDPAFLGACVQVESSRVGAIS